MLGRLYERKRNRSVAGYRLARNVERPLKKKNNTYYYVIMFEWRSMINYMLDINWWWNKLYFFDCIDLNNYIINIILASIKTLCTKTKFAKQLKCPDTTLYIYNVYNISYSKILFYIMLSFTWYSFKGAQKCQFHTAFLAISKYFKSILF